MATINYSYGVFSEHARLYTLMIFICQLQKQNRVRFLEEPGTEHV